MREIRTRTGQHGFMRATYTPATAEERLALLAQPTITPEEAAKVFGKGRSWAYEAVRRGELPSLKVRGSIFIPTAKLKELLGMEEK
jgi:excisionase family DNA binding protein